MNNEAMLALFIEATKRNWLYEYTTPKGECKHLNINNLWSFDIDDLENIGTTLYLKLPNTSNPFGRNVKSKDDTKIEQMIELLKFIIDYKQKELTEYQQKAEIKRHNDKIDRLIYEKEIEDQKNLSIEELKKLRIV